MLAAWRFGKATPGFGIWVKHRALNNYQYYLLGGFLIIFIVDYTPKKPILFIKAPIVNNGTRAATVEARLFRESK